MLVLLQYDASSFVEFRAAHGGHFRDAGRSVHGQAVLRDEGVLVFAIRRTIVTRGDQPGDAFRVGLLRGLALARQVHQIGALADRRSSC